MQWAHLPPSSGISINIHPPTKFVEQITGETDGETRYKDLDQLFWIAAITKTPGPNTYSTLNEMFTVHLGAYIKYSGPFMLVGWLYFYLYCMSCSYICLCIWVDVWVSKVNILQKAIRIPLVWGQMPAMTWHDPPYLRHTITMLFNTPWQDPSLVLHSYIPLDMTWPRSLASHNSRYRILRTRSGFLQSASPTYLNVSRGTWPGLLPFIRLSG